ncbi:MAG: hypothetical protein IPP73_18585 [Chitinophagaceae bacterium]|nr:hypothetical protein [Chitinophagaceae bacterium]
MGACAGKILKLDSPTLSPGRWAQFINITAMTPRSLFIIILKIIGIFLVKDILTTIPQLLYIIPQLNDSEMLSENILLFIITFFTLFLYSFLAHFLIFKTELIITKFKLDSGFEQKEFVLSIHRSTILSISLIVLGGFILIEEIPMFCRQLYLFFQEKRMTYGQTRPSTVFIIISGVKILTGLLLIGNQRRIVNFIEFKRKS